MELISREQLNREIVVWIARVSEAPQPPSSLHGLLDETERARAARFRFAEDHIRFVLGRSLIRTALGDCVGRKPETISLAITENGRPIFPEDESLQFSVAHTHDIVALAVATKAQVGVDFEFVKASIDLMGLAERILSDVDFHRFKALPSEQALDVFFRVWTRKEAYFKARGEGIGAGLKAVSVSFGAEAITPLTDSRDLTGSTAWQIHRLDLFEGYRGALACDVPGRLVKCFPVQWKVQVGSPPVLLAGNEKYRPAL